ncbi:MAG: GTPase [Planctomycetota bacterium]
MTGSSDGPDCQFTTSTAPTPGAVAIIELRGDETPGVLDRAFGISIGLEVGTVRLANFSDIDEGLVVRIAPTAWQLMPHGGPRIVQRLLEALEQAGATRGGATDAVKLYPEADSPIEADALLAIAHASSPAAIDRLAKQPQAWRDWFASPAGSAPHPPSSSDPRDRLLVPPTVVVVGRPNVGKSTLLNALVGRTAALVADLPGTTRDWVGSTVELVAKGSDPLADAVAVRWLDTPGLRSSDDAVEQAAIAAARDAIQRADVLVVLRSPDIDWPDADALPREADLRVLNKADTRPDGFSAEPGVLPISAKHRDGLDRLAEAVLGTLGLPDPPNATEPWAFSETLRRFETLTESQRAAYLGVPSIRSLS